VPLKRWRLTKQLRTSKMPATSRRLPTPKRKQEETLAKQLYAIGQSVSVAHRSLSGPKTGAQFKIVQRYAIENGPAMYHVRSLSGSGERMVPEGELSPATPSVIDPVGDLPGKVLWLFPQVVPFDRNMTR
jgi:hypothetical protein